MSPADNASEREIERRGEIATLMLNEGCLQWQSDESSADDDAALPLSASERQERAFVKGQESSCYGSHLRSVSIKIYQLDFLIFLSAISLLAE